MNSQLRSDLASPPPHPSSQPVLRSVHNELHERVSVPVTAPARIRHSAYLLPPDQESARGEVRSAFREMLRELGILEGTVRWGERAGYGERRFADGRLLRLVWELHTEFYSYTTIQFPPERPAQQEDLIPPFTLPYFPAVGEKLVDLDLSVIPGTRLGPAEAALFWDGRLYGGELSGGGGVWTSFQLDTQGQSRYVIAAGSLAPGPLGRLVRNVLEVETYYHLLLLPLPEYRKQVALLHDAESRITERSEAIAADLARRDRDPEREYRWLVYLTRDLADLIRVTERMRYRLSASNSYYAIFEERLDWLGQSSSEDYESIRDFLLSRITPAIRNYRNFIVRADALSAQFTSLGNMMRTRVNLGMEQQNLETMRVMNRRVELQLMLQRTVEGLSLIVLSYYLTSLTGIAFKSLNHLMPVGVDLAPWSAATIPLWLGLSWLLTRRARRLAHG